MIFHTKVVMDIRTGEILSKDLPHLYDGPLEFADKKAKKMAQQAAQTAGSESARYGAQASDIGSTLVPEFRREATSPIGFNPNDLNATLVAGEQGAGGAAGSLAGEAGLRASRSRNTGALSGVLGEISRNKGRQLSENALNVQGMNMREKARQKTEGLHGLESVYGTDVGAGLKEASLVPEDIHAMLEANKTGWGKNLMNWVQTLSGAGTAAAGLKNAFG